MSYYAGFSMRQQVTIEKYFVSENTCTNFGVWRQSIPSVHEEGGIGFVTRERRA
jgi:hypothetical protein